MVYNNALDYILFRGLKIILNLLENVFSETKYYDHVPTLAEIKF
jgi:hypothetical protein